MTAHHHQALLFESSSSPVNTCYARPGRYGKKESLQHDRRSSSTSHLFASMSSTSKLTPPLRRTTESSSHAWLVPYAWSPRSSSFPFAARPLHPRQNNDHPSDQLPAVRVQYSIVRHHCHIHRHTIALFFQSLYCEDRHTEQS